ncbi:hypothetical protein [Kribbella sp. NPDC004875]|uniref:hypothetical protein n=1 Tax=Kribbella sp. NPDC004875 TaxID=3364107 RepID=UPI0036B1B7B0
MVTPTSPPTAADRARWAAGAALGILHPQAIPLRDGRVWLNRHDDVLAARVLRSLEELLARRAADHVSNDRLLAEAVGVLGAEIARARDESPARGATDALDRFLRGPGLDQSRRTEGEAMLRVALSAGAADDPEAAARLQRLAGEDRPVPPSEILTASATISRDAQLVGLSPPPPQRAGRHRPQVGNNHRRARGYGRRLWTSQIRGTGLVTGAEGRTESSPPLDEARALRGLLALNQVDLSGSLTDAPDVDFQNNQAVLRTTATAVPQHVQVEIGQTTLGAMGQGIIRSGTASDPHILRISSQVADAQLRHVWTHQLAQMTQEIAAAEAGRPRGILGRLRSAFGHERRDRRLQADHAAYQVLVRDWHDARTETLAFGRPSGPRSVADLERDLTGLARTIRRHGGSEPALPWTAEAIVSPEAAAFGIAAARAEAEAKPARGTNAHLRAQVVAQIESLESTVAELEDQSDTKNDTAEDAKKQADKLDEAADAEEQQLDIGAAERARVLRKTASGLRHKAERHTEIRDGYGVAAVEAQLALESYRSLLSDIDGGAPQSQIVAQAAAAEHQVGLFQTSRDAALPAKDFLRTGVPEGEPVKLPVDRINQALAAHRIKGKLPTRGPQPLPSAEYRRLLAEDGMVFSIPGSPDDPLSKMPQVRLRMRPRNIRELTTRDFELAEQMSGTLGEGGMSIATTNTHSTSQTVGVNLGPVLALAAPGTPVHAAAQLISPKVEVTRGRTLAETGGATAHYQSGWVDVMRGESLLYEWDGVLEIEVRSSPTEPWSPVETVDLERQQTWVSSAYTVKPPAETVSLAELGYGDQVTGVFPRHTVTSFTGLQGVTDRLVARAQQQYGDLDQVAYGHIAGLIENDSHRLLREMTQPGGITRRFTNGDNSEYELTWELEPVWGTAELVGESSAEMWQEEVLVDFGGINAGQIYGTSLTGSGSIGFPGVPDPGHLAAGANALNDVAGSGVNLGPRVSAGRNVSRQGGQTTSMTTIVPSVQRNEGPTQGVLLGFRAKATLHKVGDKRPPIVERDLVQGLLRIPENDLLRAGGRADKNAVQRESDGSVKLHKGRVLLRGDPEPSTVPHHAPPWMGNGKYQLRGTGRGMPQNLQGAEETRDQALAGLRELGLVPRPGERSTPWQRANWERIQQQINAPRMEAGFNQAAQGGLIVVLEDRGLAGAPRWRPFRLSATPDYDERSESYDVEDLGTSTSESAVLLGISSRATQRTIGRSKSLPLSAGVEAKHGPEKGVRGWMAKVAVKFSRNAAGRSTTYTAGERLNRVGLGESTEPIHHLRKKVRFTFAEITNRGDGPLLADVRGSVDVGYPSSLTTAAAPVFEKNPKPPHPSAVEQAVPFAVDAGNAADELCAAIPAIRADSTAALHEALSPNSLMANREWMNGSYRLPFTVVQAPGNPLHALTDGTILPQEYEIVIRGEPISLTHVAMTQDNTVDINFTMTDVGYTSGTSKSGGFSVEAGGGSVAADGATQSGGLSGGRTGGTSQSTTVSETSGEERLLINPGTHHEFLERYRMYADIVHNGKVVRTVALPEAMAEKSMAERRALELYASGKLDLPLWVTTDVAERYLNDRTTMDADVALGFVHRYRQDKAGVDTGLAATHTPERFAAKLNEQTGAQPAPGLGADEQLTAAMQAADVLAQQARVMHTSPVYDGSLGAGEVESVRLESDPDQLVDLTVLAGPQIDEIAPGLRDASKQLQHALETRLTKDSYQGHLEDMLSPAGAELAIEVPLPGQQRPDVLFVKVWARFEGDITVKSVPTDEHGNILKDADGKERIPTVKAVGAKQDYDYEQIDQTANRTVAITGGVSGGTPTALGDGSGGLSTDLTTTNTSADSTQNTNIRRLVHGKKTMAERTIVFTTEVVRVHKAGAAAMASARWQLGRIDPADITSRSSRREVRAVLRTTIPTDELKDGPRPAEKAQALEERAEHRGIQLPEGASVLRYVSHGQGAKRQDELYDNLTAYLRRPDVLGRAGMAEYRHVVRPMLKASAVKAKVGRLLDGGIDLPPLAKPGNGKTMISVNVTARPVGWELTGDQMEGQQGHVWRRQKVPRTGSTRNRRTPLTVDGGIAAVSGSMGEQVKEGVSEGKGTRFELSRFADGQLVTVRIPIQYDATIRTTTDNGRGEPVTRKTDHVQGLASGQLYVRMLRHQFLEGLRQMEAGASLDSVLASTRLQAVPEKLGRPDITTTEYRQGQSGRVYQPYRPLLDAIDRARTTGKPVVLKVREDDGTERLYQALPGDRSKGTPPMLLGVNDGGFASAFATLHPTVVQMAEGRVDLRRLYNTSAPEGSFNAKVSAELEQAGVPRDVLKALDYTTAARTLAPPPEHRARPSTGGAGRTITPSSHGPTLAGP